MEIEKRVDKLPEDTIASIATSGLIGDKYIMLEPGADSQYLKNGSVIEMTDPAMVLERLIGRFLYKSGQ
jgi:phospholipid/cholesterol/gamma-HCH transport system substrate-binding protein